MKWFHIAFFNDSMLFFLDCETNENEDNCVEDRLTLRNSSTGWL